MKRLFTSLLLTLFAFGGGTAWAQYVKGAQITNATELAQAQYIAVEAVGNNSQGFFGSQPSISTSFQEDGATVFELIRTGEQISLKRAKDNLYLQTPTSHSGLVFSDNATSKALLTVKLADGADRLRDARTLGNDQYITGINKGTLWRFYIRRGSTKYIMNSQGQNAVGWRSGELNWTTFRVWKVEQGSGITVTVKYKYNGMATTMPSKTLKLSTSGTYEAQGVTIPTIYGAKGTATPALTTVPSNTTTELVINYVDDEANPLPFEKYDTYSPDNTFCLIKLKDSYAKYEGEASSNKNIVLGEKDITDAHQFQFVGNPVEGFYLYNKEKGNFKFGVDNKTADNAIFNAKNESNAVRLHLKKKGSQYYLLLDGTDHNYVNDRTSKFSTWDNARAFDSEDHGSQIVFENLDNNFWRTTFENDKRAVQALDFFDETGFAESPVPDVFNRDSYIQAKQELHKAALPKNGTLMRIQPLFHHETSQKFLSGNPIEGQVGTGQAAVANLLSQVQESTAGNDLATVFLYQDGKLICLGTSKALQQKDNEALVGSYEEGSNVVFTMTPDNVYNIQVGEKYLKADANNNYGFAVSRVGDNDGRLMLKKVSALPLPIKDLGYATFWTPVAVTLPTEGTYTAYKAKKDTNNQLLLQKITGTIPAQTAFIVKGQTGTCTLAVEGATPETTVADNELVGAATNQEILPTEEYFALTRGQNSQAVFGKLPSSMKRIAFKAYWKSEVTTAGVPEFSFRFVQPTAILSPATQADLAAPYYDLSGRRVQQPVKGGLYLQAGKKVIAQ